MGHAPTLCNGTCPYIVQGTYRKVLVWPAEILCRENHMCVEFVKHFPDFFFSRCEDQIIAEKGEKKSSFFKWKEKFSGNTSYQLLKPETRVQITDKINF